MSHWQSLTCIYLFHVSLTNHLQSFTEWSAIIVLWWAKNHNLKYLVFHSCQVSSTSIICNAVYRSAAISKDEFCLPCTFLIIFVLEVLEQLKKLQLCVTISAFLTTLYVSEFFFRGFSLACGHASTFTLCLVSYIVDVALPHWPVSKNKQLYGSKWNVVTINAVVLLTICNV